MINTIPPSYRRRIAATLWLSAILHALPIYLIRQPRPTPAAQSELHVQLTQAINRQQETPPVSIINESLLSVITETIDYQALALQPFAAPQPALENTPAPVAETLSPTQLSDNAITNTATHLANQEVHPLQIEVPLPIDTIYYKVRELDAVPVPLENPEPVFPALARTAGISGQVNVRIYIELDGSVSNAEVVSVTPDNVFGESFKQSALDASKNMRFHPSLRNGRPVRVVATTSIRFEHNSKLANGQ